MSSSKSVLITGGAGYVGSILTNKLVEQNYHVKVIDSLVYGDDGISKLINEEKIDFFNLDIRDSKNLLKLIDDVDVRAEMSKSGQALASRMFSPATACKQILTALSAVEK